MSAATQPASPPVPQSLPGVDFFAIPEAERLRWLVRLRWVALAGVAAGIVVAKLLALPWVAPRPLVFAVVAGVFYNLAFLIRLERQAVALIGVQPGERGRQGLWYFRRISERLLSRELSRPPQAPSLGRELELHALADVGALTVLLLASGGVRNPVSMFYGFHVVLGAMLGYSRGALLAALVAGIGIGALVLAEHLGWLLAPVLTSPPLWLSAGAGLIAIGSLAYFALGVLRFVEREQGRAVRNYDLLLQALDALQVGLELVAPDGRLLLANRRAAAIHPSGDGVWRPPSGVELEAESALPRRFAHIEGGETRIYEVLALSGVTADGLRAFMYVDRTEATVDEQRAIMLERLASLGRVMQEVAHELNTPLASIQTLAVDLTHTVSSPDAAESIALIVDEARRCREISRELLSTARLGSASPMRTVLGDVVRRAARLTYGNKRSGVSLKGEAELACVTDADRLLQILVNLLQNASDAVEQPAEVTLLREGESAVIEVRDHGPGLPPSVAARLFVPFVSTKPPGQGTGLGLYTCARLAQQLRGQLSIGNADSGGVLARLRLPIHPVPTTDNANQQEETPP